MLACPQAGWREVCPSSCHLAMLPSPSKENTSLTLHHSMALDLGHPGPRRRLDLGMQRQLGGAGCSPDRAAVAIVGVYSRDAPEAAQISYSSVVARFPVTASLSVPAQAEQTLQPH